MNNKIFVGTLYSGEAEYDDCIKMIHNQKEVEIKHITIQGLSEKPAHNALWDAWNKEKKSGDYAAFIKIDADTVLKNKYIMHYVLTYFSTVPNITAIQAPLHDFYTDSLINGLNCFTPEVIFKKSTSDLYCDRVDSGHKVVYRQKDLDVKLIPAGYHSPNPTFKQAFHYGLHRNLKGQHAIITKVKNAFENSSDKHQKKQRGFALIGAKMAQEFIGKNNFNYTDDAFNEAYEIAVEKYDEYFIAD